MLCFSQENQREGVQHQSDDQIKTQPTETAKKGQVCMSLLP